MADLKVRRGNVILIVPDYQKAEYLAKGFDVVDFNTGKVIESSLPSDVNVLKKAFIEHTALLKKKDEEIAILNKKLHDLQTVGAEKASTESKEEIAVSDTAPKKPKKTAKSK